MRSVRAQQLGYGSFCARIVGATVAHGHKATERDDQLDPIREPWTADVRVWRNGDTAQPCGASIPRSVVWHSPDGFNFGYGGSGPADLALNILNAFVPPGREIDYDDPTEDFERDDAPEKCFRGECSRFAARHHQDFKREFIAGMREPGGTISATTIQTWIDARRRAA